MQAHAAVTAELKTYAAVSGASPHGKNRQRYTYMQLKASYTSGLRPHKVVKVA
jgi:hypothetical protein